MDYQNEEQIEVQSRELKRLRENVQKKTFERWTNRFLIDPQYKVKNLLEDLRDGRRLIRLVEVLQKVSIGRPNQGILRVQRVDNVSRALDVLRNTRKRMRDPRTGALRDGQPIVVGVGNENIVDGDVTLTLGLIWQMIRHYHIAMIAEELTVGGDQGIAKGAKSVNEALLLWCQQKTRGYANCGPVKDFHRSWRDGMAFNALLHSHRPESFDYAQLSPANRLDNLNHAFDIAAEEFGVPRLLDAEDVAVDDPDEKSIIIYVTDLYSALNRAKTEETGSKRITNFLGDIQKSAKRVQQYEANISGLLEWIRRTVAWLDNRSFPNTVAGLQDEKRRFNQYVQVEKFERFGELTNLEVLLYDIQTLQRNEGHRLYTPRAGATLEDLGQAWARLEAAEQAREAALVAEIIRQLEMEKRARHFTSVLLPARMKTLAELGSAVASLRIGDDSLKEAEDAWERLLRVQSAIHNQEAIRFEPFYAAAKRLIDENYHDKAAIARNKDEVRAQWVGLTEAFAEKEASLRPYAEMASAGKEMEAMRAQLQALREAVTSRDTGADLMACEDLLARHRISEQELIALHEQVNRLATRARRLCDGRTTGAPAMSLSQKLMSLEEDYQSLLQAFADRRSRLEAARDFHQLSRSCEDEEAWLAEKLAGLGRLQQQQQQATTAGHGDLRAACRLVSRLQIEEAEIEHRQSVKFAHLCAVCESAQQQLTDVKKTGRTDDDNSDIVETAKHREVAIGDWLRRLRSGWRDLRHLLHACQADAAQRLDVHQFFSAAGEADDHMADVAPLLAGHDVGHDAGSAAALLKRHRYLRQELEAFGRGGGGAVGESNGELAGLREMSRRLTSDEGVAAANKKSGTGEEADNDQLSSLGDEDDFEEEEDDGLEEANNSVIASAEEEDDPIIAVEEPFEELITEIKLVEAEEPRRIKRVVVNHSYTARDPKKRDLSAEKGDIFELLQKTNKDWYSVRDLTTNKRGFLPAIYLTEISPTTVTVRVPRPVEVTMRVPRTRTVFKRASELEDGGASGRVASRRPEFRRGAGDLHRRSRRRLSRWRRRGRRRGRHLSEAERTAVRQRMEQLDETFAKLSALAAARERSLAQAGRQFRFFELAEAFADWLAGKEAALAADEPPFLILANGSAAVRKRCERHFQEMAANKGRLDELDILAKELLADAATAAKEAADAAASSATVMAAEAAPAAKRAEAATNKSKGLLKGLHDRWDRLNKLKIQKEKKLADSSSIERFAKRSQETKEQLEERRDLLAERRDPGQHLAGNAAQLAHHRHLCKEIDALKSKAAELDYEGRAVKEVHPTEAAFIDARLEKLADLAELVSEMAAGRERELCERREKLLLEAEAAKALERLEAASADAPLSPARSGSSAFSQQQRRLNSVDEPSSVEEDEEQLDQLLASTEALEQSLDAQLAASGTPRDPQLLALRQRLRAKRAALADATQRRRRQRQTEASARRFLREADRATAGLAAWQRRLTGLRSPHEVDLAISSGLEPLSRRVADLSSRWESAQSPRLEIGPEDRQKVEARLAGASEALAAARAAGVRRRGELRDAAELAAFALATDELAEWLAEKRPAAEDRSHRQEGGGDIQRRQLRHRAFEAEMAAHAPQLQTLRKEAQQLQAKGHPGAQEALDRLAAVESLWSSVEAAAAEKGVELKEAQLEQQLMERLEAAAEQAERLAKEAARAPVVEDDRSARAQWDKQEYLEERLAQCASQTAELAKLGKELADRGHYNSEALLAALRKQEVACESLAPRLAERRDQLVEAEATCRLNASLDRELRWADERLMSAAMSEKAASAATPTPESERLLRQSQAGLQTELAGRRAAIEKLLEMAKADGSDGGKAKELVERMEKLEAVLAKREEQLQQAAIAQRLSVDRAESEQQLDDCALLLGGGGGGVQIVAEDLATSALPVTDAAATSNIETLSADPIQQRAAAEKALKRLAGVERSLADMAASIPGDADSQDPRRRRLSELRRQAAEQRAALEARRDRARLAAEVADARELIDVQLVIAASEEYGADAEQCERLCASFEDFRATSLAPLGARVAALLAEAEAAAAADETMAKVAADLGDYWRLLEHYAECRAANLAKAAEVHDYNRDACELMQAAEDKLMSIPSELGRDAGALEKYTARHYVLLQELTPLEERLVELRDRSVSLEERLDPANANLIAARQRRVEEAFDRLEVRQQERVKQLDGAHEMLSLARQRQAVKSWLEDARPEIDALLGNLADAATPGEAVSSAEAAEELARQLKERLADVKILADEGEKLCDREETDEFTDEIEKIVDDAITMKATLDDRLSGLERRAVGLRAIGDFAEKARQAKQALSSAESRAAVLAPSVDSASAEQAQKLHRELEALRVLCERAVAQRLPACREAAATAVALPSGCLADEERRGIESRLSGLELMAEQAAASIEAARVALSTRLNYLDYVTADAEINDLIGAQLARIAAADKDKSRRPQQLLRLQDFKDAADAQRDRVAQHLKQGRALGGAAGELADATDAAWARLTLKFEERAHALETARSLLRLLADCERIEAALLEVKPLLDAYQAAGCEGSEEADAFLYDALMQLPVDQDRIDTLLADAAVLNSSTVDVAADPEVTAAVRRAEKAAQTWSEARPRLAQCRQELAAKVRYHRFRRAGDELDRELDRLGELLDADDAFADDASTVAERIRRNCRVRDTEAKKLAGMLAKMSELRDEFESSGIYPQAGATCRQVADKLEALRQRCTNRDRRLQDERRCAEVADGVRTFCEWATDFADRRLAEEEAAGAATEPTTEDAERRLALNRDRRTELERRLADAARLRSRAADLATASTVAGAEGGDVSGVDFAAALREPRERLEAVRLRVRQRFERHSEILAGDAACAQLAERVASVSRSLDSLESRLTEAAAVAAAEVDDNEASNEVASTAALSKPSTSMISASAAASELRQLRDRLAECQETCDSLPPGSRHAAAVAEQLSAGRRRCDTVAALVDAAAKRHTAGDRLAAYLQHCDNFRSRLEARLLRLDEEADSDAADDDASRRGTERLETLLAEVRGYSRQLEGLADEGDQLTEALDSAAARRAIADRMDDLRKLHSKAVERCSGRLLRGRRVYSVRQLLQRCRDLERFCRTVNDAIDASTAAVAGGSGAGGLSRAKQALKEQAGLLADLEARSEALKEAESALTELLNDGLEVDEGVATCRLAVDRLGRRFAALRRLLRAHGAGLARAVRVLHHLAEAEDEAAWLEGRAAALAGTDVGRSSADVQRLTRRLRRAQEEIENRRPLVVDLIDAGKALLSQTDEATQKEDDNKTRPKTDENGSDDDNDVDEESARMWRGYRATDTRRCTDRLRTSLASLDRAVERRRTLLADAERLFAYLDELGELRAWVEDRLAGLTALETAVTDAQDDSACLARAKTTEALLADAETAAERLRELAASAKQLDHDLVDERQAEAQRLSDSLTGRLRGLKRRLEETLIFFEFSEQVEEMQAWLRRQEAALKSIEPGTDEESCERSADQCSAVRAALRQRQPQLDKLDARLQALQAEKNCRLEAARALRDRLQSQLAGVHLAAKDLAKTLHDSRRIHRLLYEAASLHEALQEKLREVQRLASYGDGPVSTEELLRRLAMLTDSEFKPLAARRDDLGKKSRLLTEEFKGTDAEQVIRDDVSAVERLWQELTQSAEAKRRDLQQAKEAHASLGKFVDLLPALQALLAAILAEDLARDFKSALEQVERSSQRAKDVKRRDLQAQEFGRSVARWSRECSASLAEFLTERVQAVSRQLELVHAAHKKRHEIYLENVDIRKVLERCAGLDRWLDDFGREFAQCAPAFEGPAAEQLEARARRSDELTALLLAQEPRVEALRELTLLERRFQEQQKAEAEQQQKAAAKRTLSAAHSELTAGLLRRQTMKAKEQEQQQKQQKQQKQQQSTPVNTRPQSVGSASKISGGSGVHSAHSGRTFSTKNQRGDSGRLSDLMPPSIEGELEIRQELQFGGAKNPARKWKKRYAALCGHQLALFKSRAAYNTGDRALHSLVICAAQCDTDAEHRNTLRLQLKDGSMHLLMLPSNQDSLAWRGQIKFRAGLDPSRQLAEEDAPLNVDEETGTRPTATKAEEIGKDDDTEVTESLYSEIDSRPALLTEADAVPPLKSKSPTAAASVVTKAEARGKSTAQKKSEKAEAAPASGTQSLPRVTVTTEGTTGGPGSSATITGAAAVTPGKDKKKISVTSSSSSSSSLFRMFSGRTKKKDKDKKGGD